VRKSASRIPRCVNPLHSATNRKGAEISTAGEEKKKKRKKEKIEKKGMGDKRREAEIALQKKRRIKFSFF
jgi:hypothetical protein